MTSYMILDANNHPWRETPSGDPSIFASAKSARSRTGGHPQFTRVVQIVAGDLSFKPTQHPEAEEVAGYWVIDAAAEAEGR